LTLVATDAKLVAYAPGRMKAAKESRARHLHLTEPVFRLFGVPGNARALAVFYLKDSYAKKESNGEDDRIEVRNVRHQPGEGCQS
jgi:hypothetical protein